MSGQSGAPTLGTELLSWLEDDAELVHGAGTVRGERVRWIPDPAAGIAGDPERCAIVQRVYELYPSPWCPSCSAWNDVEPWDHGHTDGRGHLLGWTCPAPRCGEPLPAVRGWKHYALSRPKGWSKSGLASKLVVVEAVGPARFDGWGRSPTSGEVVPVGAPHRAPMIRCYATEEGQTDHSFKPAAYILQRLRAGGWAHSEGVEVDVGINEGEKSTTIHLRTVYGTRGQVEPRTSSGSAATGGQTTFAVADETWRWIRPAMHDLWNNEVANIGKSDAPGWLLETSTYPEPGRGSVAEVNLDAGGTDPPYGRLVDHRGFRDLEWLLDADQRTIDVDRFAAECRHAYGSAVWAFSLPARLAEFQDVTLELGSLIRQFGNRSADLADRYLPSSLVRGMVRDDVDADWQPDDGQWITAGFDGGRTDDHTGLVGAHVPTGTLFLVGHWDPADTPTDSYPDGEVDDVAVDREVDAMFGRWHVPRLYPDPPYWRSFVAAWSQRHGSAVRPFHTQQQARMTAALRAFREDCRAGRVKLAGDPTLVAHLTNAVLVTDEARVRDREVYPDGRVWRLAKPTRTRHDPTNKIDLAVCAVLAWAALLDSRAADEQPKQRKRAEVWSY